MKKKNRDNNVPPFSQKLEDICKLLEQSQKDYIFNKDQVVIMDKLTQDYLHDLELNSYNYAERAKIATKIKKCRVRRRQHKDVTIGLDPLVQFLGSEKGKQFYNLLREILGKTRKAEEKLSGRIYWHRVLDQEPIIGQKINT